MHLDTINGMLDTSSICLHDHWFVCLVGKKAENLPLWPLYLLYILLAKSDR